jgi:hypothetical protein
MKMHQSSALKKNIDMLSRKGLRNTVEVFLLSILDAQVQFKVECSTFF